MLDKKEWTSLEVAKLIVGILTPLSIWYFTNVSENSRAVEAARQITDSREQAEEEARYTQVTQNRTKLWSEISPKLNDIYCYFLYVGHWKDLSPDDILRTKREVDKVFYSNLPFFSPYFINEYSNFMKQTFRTGNGWKEDAKLRSSPIRDTDKGQEARFTEEDNTDAIFKSYFYLLKLGAKEMDLDVNPPLSKPEQPPVRRDDLGN